MHPFHPDNYFDLTSFAHAELFDKTEPVWMALKKLSSYLAKQKLGIHHGEIHPKAELVHPETIFIGKGSVIEAGAMVVGPCFIGEQVQIRHGAYLRGNILAGDYSIIGHTTEVKNAIFLPYAQAAHFAYVGDSILGKKVNLGAGTKLANLRLDGKNVSVTFENQHIDTHLRKFGAIVGDGAQLGCNVVSNPGTLFGKNSAVHPCLNPHGVIPEGGVVKGQTDFVLVAATQRGGA